MISIAMATYNGAKYIREQLDSILVQTVQDFELVICDDCSVDETWSILEEYAEKDDRIRIFRNENNLGFKKNFEKVIGLTRGEYVALSDQDDVWESNHIELLMQHLENKMIACGDAMMVDSDGVSMGMMLSYQESLDYVPDDDLKKAYTVYYFRSPFQGSAMLIKREFFDKALPIPDEIAYHDAWFSQLACFYGGINFFPVSISKYRRHARNVTGDKIRRRPKLRSWFWHLRYQQSLKNRIYVVSRVQERVSVLSFKQRHFLLRVDKHFRRKRHLWGRFQNSLFEAFHYKLIFSCDSKHWL